MPKRYSSEDVAWLLSELGILFARHSKEDVFQGYFRGRKRTVVVPRNRRQIANKTFSSILQQTGLTKTEAGEILAKR